MFPWAFPFLSILLFLSPSPPCLLYLFLSASIDQLCFCPSLQTVRLHTFLFHRFRVLDVRAHLRHIHLDRSCGLCGSVRVRVRAYTSRDSTNIHCWMEKPLPPIHQLAAAPVATCSPESLRRCGIAAASPQHPGFPSHHVSHGVGLHIVIQFSCSGYFPIDRTLAVDQ